MSTTPTYEDLEAKCEINETPESVIFVVHLPDGFKREHIGAKVEYDVARVRVHGERSLGNNIRARFNALYQVPNYCDINKVKGKFDGKLVIITLPTIPGVPREKPQPTQEEPSQEAESNSEEEKEGTPTDDSQESKEEDDNETSTPRNETQEPMDQKGQEEIPPKATLAKVESEKHVGEEASSTSTPPEDTQESKAQKGQEEISPKDTVAKVDSEKHVGQEASSTSTPPKDTQESKAQEEGIPPKDTNAKVDSETQVAHEPSSTSTQPQDAQGIHSNATLETKDKLQEEEKFGGEVDENEEKQMVDKKLETEEDHSLESGKPHDKTVVDDDSPKEDEGKEESKEMGTIEGEKGREISCKIYNEVVGKKSAEKAMMTESRTRARIKEVAASASEAMTSLAKKFNEEDKQKIIYIGAAVIVVALGVYATFKINKRLSPSLPPSLSPAKTKVPSVTRCHLPSVIGVATADPPLLASLLLWFRQIRRWTMKDS